MRLVVLARAEIITAGCALLPPDYAWCAEHVEDVNAHFLANVYGGDAVFAAGDTPLKRRIRAYFADPSSVPEGVSESERSLAGSTTVSAALMGPLPPDQP